LKNLKEKCDCQSSFEHDSKKPRGKVVSESHALTGFVTILYCESSRLIDVYFITRRKGMGSGEMEEVFTFIAGSMKRSKEREAENVSTCSNKQRYHGRRWVSESEEMIVNHGF
jgi:hypothetical protein